jgi:hypothetical protein
MISFFLVVTPSDIGRKNYQAVAQTAPAYVGQACPFSIALLIDNKQISDN